MLYPTEQKRKKELAKALQHEMFDRKFKKQKKHAKKIKKFTDIAFKFKKYIDKKGLANKVYITTDDSDSQRITNSFRFISGETNQYTNDKYVKLLYNTIGKLAKLLQKDSKGHSYGATLIASLCLAKEKKRRFITAQLGNNRAIMVKRNEKGRFTCKRLTVDHGVKFALSNAQIIEYIFLTGSGKNLNFGEFTKLKNICEKWHKESRSSLVKLHEFQEEFDKFAQSEEFKKIRMTFEQQFMRYPDECEEVKKRKGYVSYVLAKEKRYWFADKFDVEVTRGLGGANIKELNSTPSITEYEMSLKDGEDAWLLICSKGIAMIIDETDIENALNSALTNIEQLTNWLCRVSGMKRSQEYLGNINVLLGQGTGLYVMSEGFTDAKISKFIQKEFPKVFIQEIKQKRMMLELYEKEEANLWKDMYLAKANELAKIFQNMNNKLYVDVYKFTGQLKEFKMQLKISQEYKNVLTKYEKMYRKIRGKAKKSKKHERIRDLMKALIDECKIHINVDAVKEMIDDEGNIKVKVNKNKLDALLLSVKIKSKKWMESGEYYKAFDSVIKLEAKLCQMRCMRSKRFMIKIRRTFAQIKVDMIDFMFLFGVIEKSDRFYEDRERVEYFFKELSQFKWVLDSNCLWTLPILRNINQKKFHEFLGKLELRKVMSIAEKSKKYFIKVLHDKQMLKKSKERLLLQYQQIISICEDVFFKINNKKRSSLLFVSRSECSFSEINNDQQVKIDVLVQNMTEQYVLALGSLSCGRSLPVNERIVCKLKDLLSSVNLAIILKNKEKCTQFFVGLIRLKSSPYKDIQKLLNNATDEQKKIILNDDIISRIYDEKKVNELFELYYEHSKKCNQLKQAIIYANISISFAHNKNNKAKIYNLMGRKYAKCLKKRRNALEYYAKTKALFGNKLDSSSKWCIQAYVNSIVVNYNLKKYGSVIQEVNFMEKYCENMSKNTKLIIYRRRALSLEQQKKYDEALKDMRKIMGFSKQDNRELERFTQEFFQKEEDEKYCRKLARLAKKQKLTKILEPINKTVNKIIK